MEYQLVFSPRLGISANDFVTAWNEETQEVAEARLVPSSERSYTDPAVVDAIVFVVTNVGVGLATNALYDLIKGAVMKKGPKKHLKITKLNQPDGTHLLVIDEEEN